MSRNSTVAESLPPVTVTDVKNYLYCKRVPFYTTFLAQRPLTYKMTAGNAGHDHTSELEERRSLRAYRLSTGDRHFRPRLYSAVHNVAGMVDMVIVTESEAIPVEFKQTTGGVGENHRYQLALYGILVEEHYAMPVRRGFVYLIPQKRAQEVALTPELKQAALQTLDELRAMWQLELKPEPARVRARCTDCEFRRFCADI